jgi:cysteine desulfurase
LAAALGEACRLVTNNMDQQPTRVLRDHFWSSLQQQFGNRIVLNGHPQQRLPNTLNVSFVGVVGADILAALNGVAASTGSACHSGRVELSPVLAAMHVPEETGMGALRFSLGRYTTIEEIENVVGRLGSLLRGIR